MNPVCRIFVPGRGLLGPRSFWLSRAAFGGPSYDIGKEFLAVICQQGMQKIPGLFLITGGGRLPGFQPGKGFPVNAGQQERINHAAIFSWVCLFPENAVMFQYHHCL